MKRQKYEKVGKKQTKSTIKNTAFTRSKGERRYNKSKTDQVEPQKQTSPSVLEQLSRLPLIWFRELVLHTDRCIVFRATICPRTAIFRDVIKHFHSTRFTFFWIIFHCAWMVWWCPLFFKVHHLEKRITTKIYTKYWNLPTVSICQFCTCRWKCFYLLNDAFSKSGTNNQFGKELIDGFRNIFTRMSVQGEE